jgi:hypothetical protein
VVSSLLLLFATASIVALLLVQLTLVPPCVLARSVVSRDIVRIVEV